MKRYELLIVALIAPILAFPPLNKPLLWIALALPALWLFIGLPRTKLNGSLLLLLIAIGVSLFATFDIFFSAPKALGVILGVAVFFALVRRFDDDRTVAVALDLFVLAGAVLAAVGLLGTNWLGKMPVLAKATAHLPMLIRGVPGQSEGFQPNAVAGALIVFIPVQLAMIVAGGARWRALRIATFVFTGAVLVLTQSRNGWLSLFIAIVAWAVWQPRGARRWRVFATIAACLLIAAIVVVQMRTIAEREFGSNIRYDVAGRLELWSRAILMTEDFPLTGVGINGFRRVMPALYPAFLTPPQVDVAHAHNHLLTVAAEIGVPGLIAYLALWFGIAALIVETIRTTARRDTRWIAGGLGAAFIASFAFGMADVIALGAKVGIVFWMAMALVVALHARATAEAAA